MDPNIPNQPTQINEPTQLIPTTPSGKKKYVFLVVLVLFILVALGGGIYYLGVIKHQSNSQNDKNLATNTIIISKNNIVAPAGSIKQNIAYKIAFVRDNNIWVNINGKEKQITKDGYYKVTNNLAYDSNQYSSPSISPDGQKIVFSQTKFVPTPTSKDAFYIQSNALYISNIDGSNMKKLANTATASSPVEWSPVEWFNDNQHVAIVTRSEGDQLGGTDNSDIHLVDLDTENGTEQELVKYDVPSFCGGGNDDPSFLATLNEGGTIVFGYNSRYQLQLSADNNYIFHSHGGCDNAKLYEYNLQTNQDTPINGLIAQIVLSPDGSKFAGIPLDDKNQVIGNQISIVDAKSLKPIATLTTSEQPETLYWSSNGQTIYYSTYKSIKKFSVVLTGGTGVVPPPVIGNQNVASLWSISVDGLSDKKIADFNEYAIKPLYISSDNTTAIITQIDNSNAFFDELNKGNTKGLGEPTTNVNTLMFNLVNKTFSIISKNTANTTLVK